MRKRQFKKVLSLVLALAMVFTMNTSAFATPADNPAPAVEETQNEAAPETPVTNETETPAPAEEAAPAAETPAADETPAPAAEEPKAEEPAAEAPKSEEPKTERPAGDAAAIVPATFKAETGWAVTAGDEEKVFNDGTTLIIKSGAGSVTLTPDPTVVDDVTPKYIGKTITIAAGTEIEAPGVGDSVTVAGVANEKAGTIVVEGGVTVKVKTGSYAVNTTTFFGGDSTLATGNCKVFANDSTLTSTKAYAAETLTIDEGATLYKVGDEDALVEKVNSATAETKVYSLTDDIAAASTFITTKEGAYQVVSVAARPANSETTHITMKNRTKNSITVAGETGYQVGYRIGDTGDFEVAAGNIDASNGLEITGLASGTKYQFVERAAATGSAFASAWSTTPVSITTKGEPANPWVEYTGSDLYVTDIDGNVNAKVFVSNNEMTKGILISANETVTDTTNFVIAYKGSEKVEIKRVCVSNNKIGTGKLELSGNNLAVKETKVAYWNDGEIDPGYDKDLSVFDGDVIEDDEVYAVTTAGNYSGGYVYEGRALTAGNAYSLSYDIIAISFNEVVEVLSIDAVPGEGTIGTSFVEKSAIPFVGASIKSVFVKYADGSIGYNDAEIPDYEAVAAYNAANITSISVDGVTLGSVTVDNYYAVDTTSENSIDDYDWKKAEDTSVDFNSLTDGTKYYVMTKSAGKTGFVSMNSPNEDSAFTTAQYITVNIKPVVYKDEFLQNSVIARDTLIDYVDVVTTANGEKVEGLDENDYELDPVADVDHSIFLLNNSIVVSDNETTKAKDEGVYTVTIKEPKVIGKKHGNISNNYVVATAPADKKITVVSSNTGLTLSMTGKYYYSQKLVQLTSNDKFTLKNDKNNAVEMSTLKFATGISENKKALSGDEIDTHNYTTINAGGNIYAQASKTFEDGTKVESNVLTIPVQTLPIEVYDSYKFYSLMNGDLDKLSTADEVNNFKNALYLRAGNEDPDNDKTEIKGTKIDEILSNTTEIYKEVLSKNSVSFDFADIDLTKVLKSEYKEEYDEESGEYYGDYVVTGEQTYKINANTLSSNYAIQKTAGQSYYVLPKYDVQYIGLASGKKGVSKNEAASSNAAKNIDTYKKSYRTSNPNFTVDDVAANVTLPRSTNEEGESNGLNKVLDKWYIGDVNGIVDKNYPFDGGDTVTINEYDYKDVAFYASYQNYATTEKIGQYGSIRVDDIVPVNYTGKKLTSALPYNYLDYKGSKDKAGKALYKYGNSRKNTSQDITLRVYNVSGNDQPLLEGRDFTVTYKNNVNAYYADTTTDKKAAKKAPLATIKFIGDYSGKPEMKVNFHINPLPLADGYNVTMGSPAYKLNTKASSVKVNVNRKSERYQKKKLTANKDYTLLIQSVSKGSAAIDTSTKDGKKTKLSPEGWYKVTVKGTGNYTGKLEYSLTATSYKNGDKTKPEYDLKFYLYGKGFKNVSKLKVTFVSGNKYACNENGSQIKPQIKEIKDGSKSISVDQFVVTYAANNEPKAGYVYLMPKETSPNFQYYGSKAQKFTITALALPAPTQKKYTVSYDGNTAEYHAIKVISFDGVKPDEWKIGPIKNNGSLPGTYTVKVEGLKKYAGKTKNVKVAIDKIKLTNNSFMFMDSSKNTDKSKLSENYVPGGVTLGWYLNPEEGKYPVTASVNTAGGSKNFVGTIFTTKYSNNKKLGTATVKVSPVKKYADFSAFTQNYTVGAAKLGEDWLVNFNFVSDNKLLEKPLKTGILQVYDWNNKGKKINLKENKDFTYKISEASGNNLASVEVTGTGNYTGKHKFVSPTYKGLMSQAKVTIDKSEKTKTYTGDKIIPKVTVKIGDTTISDNQYTLEFSRPSMIGVRTMKDPDEPTETIWNSDNIAVYPGTVTVSVKGLGKDYGWGYAKNTVKFTIKKP